MLYTTIYTTQEKNLFLVVTGLIPSTIVAFVLFSVAVTFPVAPLKNCLKQA